MKLNRGVELNVVESIDILYISVNTNYKQSYAKIVRFGEFNRCRVVFQVKSKINYSGSQEN